MQEETLEFDTLEVSGTGVKNDEKAFVTSGAVSSREGIGSNTQSIDSIVRSVPGAYTNTDQAQGGVQVNLRGMAGFGRVNTMIDGVTQTFFGGSADQGYHSNLSTSTGTSAFSAPVDSNFLISVDIEKGSFSGGHGGLMGSANFKTIGVNDLVREGNVFGFLGRFSYGSNGLGPSYMGSVAGKSELENGGYIGVLFGYSGKRITQNYTIGGGGKIGDQTAPDPDSPSGQSPAAPFDPSLLTQKPNSQLFKLEYAPNSFTSAIFNYRRYQNELAGRKINNDNYQLDFWHNPLSWIDIRFLAAYNAGKQRYNSDANFSFSPDAIANKTTRNQGYTFDISNNFYNELTGGFILNSRFGTNVLINKYKNDFSTNANDQNNAYNTAFQPKGEQRIFTYYMDNNLKYDIFELGLNLNLYDWNLKGFKPECASADASCFPHEAVDIDKNGLRLNASIMLSAAFHELFTPFASFARTNRAPNVQEMFFPYYYGNSVNPYLKPEQANTWQIGFNSFKHGLLKNDDRFGLKALYYKTLIKDYIYNEYFSLASGETIMLFRNALDKSEFKGFEVELSYDLGFAYTKASYSRQESKQPVSYTSGGYSGSLGYSRISELPKDYANIELGFRLNDRISFGGIAKYTGKAKRVTGNPNNLSDPNSDIMTLQTEELPNIPTIVDLYWNIEWLKNFTMRAEVQNAFDENYMDALNAYNSTGGMGYDQDYNEIYLFNNSARGRTFVVSFEYKY
ncbi:TonB-dependent receptor [Campylobacter sp. MIT 12-5580]|uniref:TonB-dependent receptor domain-containing protein n=1 Tax=Campylobacter sp. MIT 12-5580 TaxID=2040651 RepID=UPI002017995A|nr:TonB-dependent receptor [Campylobacter sp. MIT 12-5580]